MSKLQALIKLVKKGEHERIKQILHTQNVNANEIDPKSGKAILHMAIQNSDVDVFNVLASYPGTNLELPASDGQTPLEIAVRLNDCEITHKLLDRKVNFKRKNKQGETVIFTALRNQTNKQIIKRLFQHFDINERIDNYGSYLNLTISAGQIDNFYYLINELAVRYTIKDDEDNTSLLLAVKINKGDLVKAILQKMEKDQTMTPLEKQFFFNAQNKEGNTALHEAALKEYQTVTQILEKNGENFGFDKSLKNKLSQTVQSIKLNIENEKEKEKQLEKRRLQQRSVRNKEKKQDKVRQRQEEQRLKIEQKRRRKQEQQRMQIQSRVKNQTQKSKTLWIAGIVLLIALAGMYFALQRSIERKRLAEL